MALLRADRLERGVLIRVLARAAEYRQQLDERLARMMVAELGAALERGRR